MSEMTVRKDPGLGPVSFYGRRSGVEFRVDAASVTEVMEVAAEMDGTFEEALRVVSDGKTVLEGQALERALRTHVKARHIYQGVRLDERTPRLQAGTERLTWTNDSAVFVCKSSQGLHHIAIANDRMLSERESDLVTAILRQLQMEISFRRKEWGQQT